MSVVFIDRRILNQQRNLENRRKFFNRVKTHLLSSLKDLTEDKITDINNSKRQVAINKDSIEEPCFTYSSSGIWEYVLSGNSFIVGDEIPKPNDEGSNNSTPSDQDDTDDFIFQVNREEFLQLFFEDLDLPNMIDKSISRSDVFTWQRKGFTSSGAPANMDLRRTVRNSLGRRIALRRPKIEELEREENETDEEYLDKIARHKRVPYIDPLDLRFRHFEKQPTPTFSAVVFFLMDVSGSMTEHHKDLAKRFFMLMYFFLQKKYSNVEIVFISHTHVAKEVDEHDFFYSLESGGTLVQKALLKVSEIIESRFPLNEWNIYIGQSSDGDCFPSDGEYCVEYLKSNLLPKVQFMSYLNVSSPSTPLYISALMNHYKFIKADNFAMVSAIDKKEIFPVFRKLFSKNKEAKFI